MIKVPLTPKFFISRQKSPFCSDHIGEKIIVVRFFPDFLWIFKLRKIRTTVVHRRVTRRMGRVGLWRQPGAISLGEMKREWKDSRSEVTQGLFRGKNLLQCRIGVLLRIAVMWWICLSVYLCTTYLSLAIKQPFRENTTGQVGTDSSNSFSGTCLDGNC